MEKPKQTEDRAYKGDTNRLLQVSMYSLAAVAGVVTASFKVWDEFYSKIKRSELVRPLSEKRYEKINAVAEHAKSSSISYKQYTSEIADIEQEYSKKVNKLLKNAIGIESEGIGGIVRGTFQRAETLGPYKRARIMFSGVAAVGTTLGAYFLVNQNWRLKNELRDVHTKLDQTQER